MGPGGNCENLFLLKSKALLASRIPIPWYYHRISPSCGNYHGITAFSVPAPSTSVSAQCRHQTDTSI